MTADARCTFHPDRDAVQVDPHSCEPVCAACIHYRTCPACHTVQPFGALLDARDDTLQCENCHHIWTPTED